MRILIVIPSYIRNEKGCWMLEQTIKALLAVEEKNRNKLFILISDDGSPWEHKFEYYKLLRERFKVEFIVSFKNSGYSSAVNSGLVFAQKYRFDTVITLNNDCEMITPFIDRLDGLFSKFPKLAVVGAKLYFPTGQIQHAGFQFDSSGSPCLLDRDLYDAVDCGDSNRPKFIMGVTGAFQAIRVSALEEIGLYSPDYFLAYEDCEFCLRTWSKDWQIFYDPYIEGVHSEGATRGKGLSENEVKAEEQWRKDFSKHDFNAIYLAIKSANDLLESELRGN